MEPNLIVSSGATALVCALVLQALKNSKYVPWLGIDQVHQRVNFWVSVAIAAAATAGIDTQWDPQKHSILISGLTAANLWHWAAHGIAQWAAQHGFYKTVVAQPEMMGRLIDALQAQANRGGESIAVVPPQVSATK